MNSNNQALTTILQSLCEDAEIPAIKNPSQDFQTKRLQDQMEILSYPYPSILCPHRASLGISEDCVACQQEQYLTYKARFLELVDKNGLQNTHTLKAAFDYYQTLITRYFLTECDSLLEKIYPACEACGPYSQFYFMAIQAFSFLRFKQGRYQESLNFFQAQIDIEGPNDIIYENMALCFSRLNQKQAARNCYAKAILLIQQKPHDANRFSTLLSGLSTVLNPQEALIVLAESKKLFESMYGLSHSLVAKTLSAMGDHHAQLQAFDQAEEKYQEATQIFLDTCGEDTPLTASAMQKHGESLWHLQQNEKSMQTQLNALRLWNKVDALSFDASQIAKILLALTQQMKEDASLIRKTSAQDILLNLQEKIITTPSLYQDINAICLLKFIYEWHALNKDIANTLKTCRLFLDRLEGLEHQGELEIYRIQLANEAKAILSLVQVKK